MLAHDSKEAGPDLIGGGKRFLETIMREDIA